MDELKKVFESVGFKDVKTVIASGNIIFSTSAIDMKLLAQKIEEALKKTFGFDITVILRTGDEIQNLVRAHPFKNIKITPNTRQHVTFLSEEQKTKIKIPYESSEKDFRILFFSGREVCSVIELSSNRGTSELMSFIGKEFGKKVTTRTWNTVVKINELLI